MSEESKAEKFLEIFNKGKEFTEELLRENQRLRYRVLSLENEAASGPSWAKAGPGPRVTSASTTSVRILGGVS